MWNTRALVSCVGEIVETKLTYILFHFIQSFSNFNVLYVIEIIKMNNHNRIISSTAGHSTTLAPWHFFALFVACSLCNSRDFGALCAIRTVANVTVEPKITGRVRLYITRGT